MELMIYGSILAGMGIFFIAFKSFSDCMQEVAGHNLRESIVKYAPNTYISSFWGFIMGMMLEDMNIISCIVGSLTASGILSMRKLIFFISMANIGSIFFFYVIFFDIKIIILYMVGISGLLYYFEKPLHLRFLFGVLFYLFLMQFSIQFIDSLSDQIVQLKSVQALSQYLDKSSYIMTFLVSALIVIITQSYIPMLLLMINFFHSGLINFETVMVMTYGMHLGGAMRAYILSLGMPVGIGKRIIIFQTFFEGFVAILFLMIFYLDHYLGTNFIRDIITKTSHKLQSQVINLMLFANGLTTLIIMAFEKYISEWLTNKYPISDVFELSTPRYINKEYIYNTESSIDMLHKEVTGLLEVILKNIEMKIEQKNPYKLNQTLIKRHEATNKLKEQIDIYIQEVVNHHFSIYAAGKFFECVDEYHNAVLLEEAMDSICRLLPPKKSSEATLLFGNQILESAHLMVSVLVDALKDNQAEIWEFISSISTRDEKMFNELRDKFFAREAEMTGPEKNYIFTCIRLFQQIVWTIHQFKPL